MSEAEKWVLLKKAEALVFPSLYEGFGLPILEAQMVGTPVVTSTTSSLPEIAGGGAFLVDPTRSKELSRALVSVATDERRRAGIINEATQNVDRFSWVRCARGVAQLLKRSLSL
ncbi:MAG: glycosyltransferase [Candidatus Moraniibacteriota bacterium]|nr:MAG: glycosyltransferase [Candidatus Moranbacteria bacterium]